MSGFQVLYYSDSVICIHVQLPRSYFSCLHTIRAPNEDECHFSLSRPALSTLVVTLPPGSQRLTRLDLSAGEEDCAGPSSKAEGEASCPSCVYPDRGSWSPRVGRGAVHIGTCHQRPHGSVQQVTWPCHSRCPEGGSVEAKLTGRAATATGSPDRLEELEQS